MDIQKGMYIRTSQWGIATVNSVVDGFVRTIKTRNKRVAYYFTQIGTKPSFNIRDLIESGDLVNGHPVQESSHYGKVVMNGNVLLCDVNIKTVVTKEQLEEISYKLGDEYLWNG